MEPWICYFKIKQLSQNHEVVITCLLYTSHLLTLLTYCHLLFRSQFWKVTVQNLHLYIFLFLPYPTPSSQLSTLKSRALFTYLFLFHFNLANVISQFLGYFEFSKILFSHPVFYPFIFCIYFLSSVVSTIIGKRSGHSHTPVWLSWFPLKEDIWFQWIKSFDSYKSTQSPPERIKMCIRDRANII